MTPENADRTMFDPLRALATPAPDAARAARVRVRCRAQLSRDRARSERLAEVTRASRQVVASVALGLLCAACLADMIGIAIRTLTV